MSRRVASLAVLLAVAGVVTACNTFGYDARIESIVQDARYVTVRGWYHDPYAPRKDTTCPVVRMLVDGTQHPDEKVGFGCVEPTGRRADVEATSGGEAYGYTMVLANMSQGRHEVCVDVVPLTFAGSTDLDCVSIDVPKDTFDKGVVDTVSMQGNVVTADGWFFHVPSGSDPPTGAVRFAVDDTWIRPDTPGGAVTPVDRPDARAYAGADAVGLHLIVPIAPHLARGQHRVCLGYDDGSSPVVGRIKTACVLVDAVDL